MSDTQPTPSPAEIQARIAMEMFALKASVYVIGLLIVMVFIMVFLKVSPDATEIGVLMAVITPTVTLATVAFAYIYRSKQVPPTSTSATVTTPNTPPGSTATVVATGDAAAKVPPAAQALPGDPASLVITPAK